MKLVHWLLMDGFGCYIWYSEEGTGRGCSPACSGVATSNNMHEVGTLAHKGLTFHYASTEALRSRPVRCSVTRHFTGQHDVLKTNDSFSIPIGTSGLRSNGTKRWTLGSRAERPRSHEASGVFRISV